MPRNMSRLLDEIVFIEEVDAKQLGMDAAKYLAAARTVREIVARELGRLSMNDFVTGRLPALQTVAENIFFDAHGQFADLDGSGQAPRVRQLAEQVLQRIGLHARSGRLV